MTTVEYGSTSTELEDSTGEEPPDASLLELVKRGDRRAFDRLYRRHRRAALAVARGVTKTDHDAEDLTSEAFMRVLRTLLSGGGPTHAFRAYLFTAVRNAAYDRTRRDKKITFHDNLETYDEGIEFTDPTILDQERSILIRAMESLPERWQRVLWYTEIEGLKPAAVAPILGLSPNSTAALALRAREGLRQAYLQAHLAAQDDPGCRYAVARLGAWTRRALSRRERVRVDEHLQKCETCSGMGRDLTEINSGFRAIGLAILFGLPAGATLLRSGHRTHTAMAHVVTGHTVTAHAAMSHGTTFVAASHLGATGLHARRVVGVVVHALHMPAGVVAATAAVTCTAAITVCVTSSHASAQHGQRIVTTAMGVDRSDFSKHVNPASIPLGIQQSGSPASTVTAANPSATNAPASAPNVTAPSLAPSASPSAVPAPRVHSAPTSSSSPWSAPADAGSSVPPPPTTPALQSGYVTIVLRQLPDAVPRLSLQAQLPSLLGGEKLFVRPPVGSTITTVTAGAGAHVVRFAAGGALVHFPADYSGPFGVTVTVTGWATGSALTGALDTEGRDDGAHDGVPITFTARSSP